MHKCTGLPNCAVCTVRQMLEHRLQAPEEPTNEPASLPEPESTLGQPSVTHLESCVPELIEAYEAINRSEGRAAGFDPFADESSLGRTVAVFSPASGLLSTDQLENDRRGAAEADRHRAILAAESPRFRRNR